MWIELLLLACCTGKYLLADSAACPAPHFNIDGKLTHFHPDGGNCSMCMCLDRATCEAAATELGLADLSASIIDQPDTAPKGCFYQTMQLWFNPSGVSNPADQSRHAVCKGGLRTVGIFCLHCMSRYRVVQCSLLESQNEVPDCSLYHGHSVETVLGCTLPG